MTEDKQERWKILCELASKEQNPKRLMELIEEINEILKAREQRNSTSTQK